MSLITGGETMDLSQYLSQGVAYFVPALWVIGVFLKRTPQIKDWMIIWILLGLSVIFAIIKNGLTIDSIINGIIAAGVSVLGHQLVKQTKNRQ